jgi:hypothetical protein
MPGTTRDLISETVAIGGIPVRLVTPGRHPAALMKWEYWDRKSMEAIADADSSWLFSILQPVTEEDSSCWGKEQRAAIVVENKVDPPALRLVQALVPSCRGADSANHRRGNRGVAQRDPVSHGGDTGAPRRVVTACGISH